jgi:hypothetical protein
MFLHLEKNIFISHHGLNFNSCVLLLLSVIRFSSSFFLSRVKYPLSRLAVLILNVFVTENRLHMLHRIGRLFPKICISFRLLIHLDGVLKWPAGWQLQLSYTGFISNFSGYVSCSCRHVSLSLLLFKFEFPLSSPFHFKVISLCINVIKHIYFIVLILEPGTDMRVLGLFRAISWEINFAGQLFLARPQQRLSRDRCQSDLSGMNNWPLTLADGKTTLRNGSCSAMPSYFVPAFPARICSRLLHPRGSTLFGRSLFLFPLSLQLGVWFAIRVGWSNAHIVYLHLVLRLIWHSYETSCVPDRHTVASTFKSHLRTRKRKCVLCVVTNGCGCKLQSGEVPWAPALDDPSKLQWCTGHPEHNRD